MSTIARTRDRTEGRSSKAAADGLLSRARRPNRAGRGPRRRSPGLVLLCAFLVVASALAVVAWGLRIGQREAVVAVAQPVTKGHVIERSDLTDASVAGVSGVIPLEEIDSVVGKAAAVDLLAGQTLTTAMVASDIVPTAEQATVGLALDPDRVPAAGLEAGDFVGIVAVPGDSKTEVLDSDLDRPTLLADAAEVFEVGGEATSGGEVLVTVIVDAADAGRISAYATQNRVALVEVAPSLAGEGG